MSRRLGALLLVFIVAGAPAAFTACEITCAARDVKLSRDGATAGDSCHRGESPDTPLVSAGVQVCGHDEELPAASAQGAPLPVLAAAVVPSSVLPA